MRNDTRRWMNLIWNHPSEVERGLGDWMATDKLPVAISGRIFLILALRAWSVLTDSEMERATTIKRTRDELKQFSMRFISNKTGDVTIDGSHPTQSGQAMALFYHLVPQSMKKMVVQGLLRAVDKSDRHITTGMFGVLPLFESLTMHNRSDLAWDIAVKTTFPSYGYMIENNATSLWESWFYSNGTFSHNHPMFSGVSAWIVSHIGGVRIAKDAIGSDRILFAPNPPINSNLRFATVSLETPRGKASSHWNCQSNGKMNIEIRCPVNTRGVVVLPNQSEPIFIRGGIYRFHVPAALCENESSAT